MNIDVFPSPYHLGRPESMRKIMHRGESGIGLVSGMPASGVTTTLMALGNNAQENGLSTIHLRVNGEQAFPCVDSISISSINDDAVSYVLEECKPQVLIIDNVDDTTIPAIAYDAALLGSFVLLGMHARTEQHAMDLFEDSVYTGKSRTALAIPPKNLVRFSVNQQLVPARKDSVNTATRLLANYSMEFVQLMVEEANPGRIYPMLRKDIDMEFSLYTP